MIGHLYRYPHPVDQKRFIYVGQGPKRHAEHRRGKTPFGRRFKKLFPDVELPQPIREVVEVENYLELNELETIWMFQYHTWYGYEGGMNLVLPASSDYKNLGRIGGLVFAKSGRLAKIATPESRRRAGQIGGRVQGPISGRLAVESGRLLAISSLGGRKNVESGQLDRIRYLPQAKEAQRRNGRMSMCDRWNIRRGKSCVCGQHQVQPETHGV